MISRSSTPLGQEVQIILMENLQEDHHIIAAETFTMDTNIESKA
jgi:hypothetical protein